MQSTDDDTQNELLSRPYRLEIVDLADIRTDRFPNTRWTVWRDDDDLVESIRSTGGLVEPLIVRDGPGGLDLICGFRRFAALAVLHARTAPCRIVRCSDDEARQLNVIENLARRDLSPPEAAAAVSALHETGLTAPQIARATSTRLGTVERWLLLRKNLTPALWQKFSEPIDTITNGVPRKDYRESLFARVARCRPQDQLAMLRVFEAEAEVKSRGGRPKGAKDSRPRNQQGGIFLPDEAIRQIAQKIEDDQVSRHHLWCAGAQDVWQMVTRAGRRVDSPPT